MASEQLQMEFTAVNNTSAAFNSIIQDTNRARESMRNAGSAAEAMNKKLAGMGNTLKQQRTGFTQIGMQLNDFATSVSTGASPITAFNQQLGQMGYALSLTGGKLSAFGRFLAGPWGAAITIATAVLGPFIAGLFKTEDAQKASTVGAEALVEAEYRLQLAMAGTVEKEREIRKEMMQTAFLRMQAAQGEILFEQMRIDRLKEQAAAEMKKAASVPMAEGAELGFFINSKLINKQANEASKGLAELRDKAAAAQAAYKNMQAANIEWEKGVSSAAQRASERADKKAEAAAKKAERELRAFETAVANLDDVKIGDYAKFDPLNGFSKEIETSTKFMDNFAGQGDVALNKILAPMKEIEDAADRIGEKFATAFSAAVVGAGSFKDAFRALANDVIGELMRIYVVKQITGFISSAIGNVLGAPAALTPKAIGGPVQAGNAYMVGERGPEMFVPSRSGSIVPNSSSGGISISVDARGSSDPAAVRAQVQRGILEAAPAIIAAAEARTLSSARRPKLPGVL